MQNQKKPKETLDGTRLWLVLMKAFHSISSYADLTIEKTGLGNSDFRVLEALLHKGSMAVNELGPKVFLTPGSISVAVERLHVQGLVSRTECAKDRRVRTVDLTPKGRKLIETAFAEHASHMEVLMNELGPKEKRRLAEDLKVLGKRAATMTKE